MEKPKILIIDDDCDLIELLKVMLIGADYTILTASNKTEGMEKIAAEKPSLIVLDVMMTTWKDCFEMSRELKNDPEFKIIEINSKTRNKSNQGRFDLWKIIEFILNIFVFITFCF